MKHISVLFFCMLSFSVFGQYSPAKVIWNTPSNDALNSMPLSGYKGAGANIWVQDGSIWIYLAHNGAYDENGNLLKLGSLRITPLEIQLGKNGFSQTLDPATGKIFIKQGDFIFNMWFAGQCLIMESNAPTNHSFDVAFGIWHDNIKFDSGNTGFAWSHRNADYPFDLVGLAAKQGIAKEAIFDVTTNRVWGAALVTSGIGKPVQSKVHWQNWDGKSWTSRTLSRKSHTIAVALGAGLNTTVDSLQSQAKIMMNPKYLEQARVKELAGWSQFWNRSFISINSQAASDDPGRLVGQNYQLFRYMLACNRNGEFPLLFNGGIFTTDVAEGRITGMTYALKSRMGQKKPDFRRWGQTHFMSQNQRWLGWPTLAAGDADLLSPTMTFYHGRSITAAARAKTNGAEGVVYPESLDVWGLSAVKPLPNGLCGSEHLTYHFSMMLENAWMALQAHDVLGIDLGKHLSWIKGTVLFYDSFYRNACKERTGKELGDDGKLIIYPGNGLELISGATNPVEVVAGLTRVTQGLLALPGLSDADGLQFQKIYERLPELPIGERQGLRSLLVAKSFEKMHNKWEPLEMYVSWPYRLAGVTRSGTLELARNTWKTVPKDRSRSQEFDYSWMANVVNVSALAWPEESEKRVIYKMANNTAPQARFPAFFGPGHDWIPDHNWGGSGMTGLQEMLLAPEPGPNGKLHLFPSWPAKWDVDFKLHAPGQTVIECAYKNGKIIKLKVTPQSREKDVVNWLGKWPEFKK